MIQLSIILPVFNVERYIRSCLESILKQGLDECSYEIIIINDGTKDRSIEMIADLIVRHTNIMVINQENQGLSVARNIGMSKACGQYVLFVDSDDILIDYSLSKILFYAMHYSADMVIGDYLKGYNDEIPKGISSRVIKSDNSDIVFLGKGIDYYSHGYDQQPYVWRVLFSRKFLNYNNISFIPGIFWEDIPYMVECLLAANLLIKVSLPFYYYRQHEGSIGNSLNIKKMIDSNRVMEKLWKKKSDPLLSVETQTCLTDTLYSFFIHYKWRILLNDSVYNERREIISDLMKRVPNLRFTHGLKQLFTTMHFRLMPYRYFEIRKFFDEMIWNIKKLRGNHM